MKKSRFTESQIVDRASDEDSLRQSHLNGELICPHCRNRKCVSLQDGRALRRYKHRWKIERLLA